MYRKPEAPLSVGGVLDDAIKLYRASFGRCVVTSLIGSALLAIAGVYMSLQMRSLGLGMPGGATPADPTATLRLMAGAMGSFSRTYLLISLVSLLVYAAIFAQINDVASGENRSQAELWGLALRRVPGLFIGGIIFSIAAGVGLLLFLIPGVYLWGKLQFFAAAVFADKLGGIEALGRSWSITTNNWWRSTTILTVALIMIIVLEILAGIISALLVGMTYRTHGTDLVSLSIGSAIVRGIISIFVLPMIPAVMVSTYYDMRLRHDGADLAARANSIQPG